MRPSPSLSTLSALVLVAGCATFQQAPREGLGDEHVKLGREHIYVSEQGRGAGEAVLLIHGYCGGAAQWSAIQPALARDHHVLAVDLPGHGKSDKYPGDYSPQGLARKLWRLLDRKGVERAHIVGHSWGTSISLAMALQRPRRVRSLTLIGVWVYEEQLPPFIKWSRAPGLGELLFAMFFDERLDDRIGASFADPDRWARPEIVDRTREVLHRPGARAAALAAARGMRFRPMQRRYSTVPHRVLIIHGERDWISRLPWARRLNSELPDSRLAVVPDAVHLPIMTRPAHVLRLLRPFLAGLEPGQAPPPRRRVRDAAPRRAPEEPDAPLSRPTREPGEDRDAPATGQGEPS